MSKLITVQLSFFGPFVKGGILNPSKPQYEQYGALLEAFFELPFSALSKEVLKRYEEATIKETHLNIVPHTKEIYERLLKPLKSAKKNYCFGDYPATIASCGVVGEMLAILIWKISEVKLKDKSIDEKDEEGLFGRSFEKLGQERRLKVLKTFGQITEAQHRRFMAIKDSRNQYLHLWTVNLENEKQAALDTFKKAFKLFKEVTKIGLSSREPGMVTINPKLLKLFEPPKDKV